MINYQHLPTITRDSPEIQISNRRQGAAAFRAPGREVQRENRRPRAASATPKDVPKGDSKAGWRFFLGGVLRGEKQGIVLVAPKLL